MEILSSSLNIVFSRDDYDITIGKQSSQGVDIIIESKNPTLKLCGNLNYNTKNNMLKINMISKCSSSGTVFLEKLDQLAKIMKIDSIELEDKSNLIFSCGGKKVKLELPLLYILSTGQSWYNSKGYISSNYEDEVDKNSKLLDITIDKLITSIGYTNKIDLSLYGLDQTMKVSHVFTVIKKYLLNNNDCVLISWLMDLFKILKTKKLLSYNAKIHLTKTFIHTGGVKSKKYKKHKTFKNIKKRKSRKTRGKSRI